MKNTNITEFINFILTVVLFGGNNRIQVISLYGKKIHFSQSDSVTVRKLCRFLCNFLFFVTKKASFLISKFNCLENTIQYLINFLFLFSMSGF